MATISQRRADTTQRMRALGRDRLLGPVLIEHAKRGIRIQSIVRGLLALFIVLVVAFVPPAQEQGVSYLIAALYVIWAIGAAIWAQRGDLTVVRYVWVGLIVDLILIGALVFVASKSDEQSWTADVLVNSFFLLPVLAATQLRVWVSVAVGIPTVAIYLATSVASQHANSEPWSSILLRTMVLVVLCIACVLLSRVQRSRVLTISDLVSDRDELVAELLSIEQRERANLAEQLHDGALQYVLAARQELEDARQTGDAESFERLERALRESSTLLRSTVGQLHPVVLEHSGLVPAVRELAHEVAARTGLAIGVEADEWGERMRTSADPVLFRACRELLTNVVKHASAQTVEIALTFGDGVATLVVQDDGTGVDEGAVRDQAGAGHIGIASLRAHVEGAGGSLSIRNRPEGGTRVALSLPAELLA